MVFGQSLDVQLSDCSSIPTQQTGRGVTVEGSLAQLASACGIDWMLSNESRIASEIVAIPWKRGNWGGLPRNGIPNQSRPHWRAFLGVRPAKNAADQDGGPIGVFVLNHVFDCAEEQLDPVGVEIENTGTFGSQSRSCTNSTNLAAPGEEDQPVASRDPFNLSIAPFPQFAPTLHLPIFADCGNGVLIHM